VKQSQNLVNEWLGLSSLVDHKVAATFLRNLDKSVTSHVLHALMSLVHKLEEFVHNRLEEFPMSLEESGVLADDVHDIGRNDGLVILASLHLGQPKEILDDSNQESLFGLLACKTS